MNKIDEEDAMESLKLYQQIIEQMEEEDRLAAIAEEQYSANK